MNLVFLTLPLSTNQLWRHTGNRTYLTDRGRQNKEQIGWEGRAQYRGEPYTGPLAVRIDLYWPDRRTHDVDNIKGFLDALTGILWVDDSQIIDLRVTKAVDRDRPRVELELIPP